MRSRIGRRGALLAYAEPLSVKQKRLPCMGRRFYTLNSAAPLAYAP
jgi:hypothetical protein